LVFDPKIVGIVPVNEFSPRLIVVAVDILLMVVGIVPVRQLPATTNEYSDFKPEIVLGMLPSKEL
jgi:hypothetical protein